MKKLLIILAALLTVTAYTRAQTLESLFEKYADDERFEYVSVGKGMMNMASAFGGMAKDNKDIMSKMRSVKILTLNAGNDAPIMKIFGKELKEVIDNGNFETAVEARDKGDKVHIYYRFRSKDNADMLIVSKEKTELSLIWISGKMTKEEMMKTFSSNHKAIPGLSDSTSIHHPES